MSILQTPFSANPVALRPFCFQEHLFSSVLNCQYGLNSGSIEAGSGRHDFASDALVVTATQGRPGLMCPLVTPQVNTPQALKCW